MTVGLEDYVAQEFIYSRLSNDATLVAALAHGTASIFDGVAPEDEDGPWISYTQWTTGEDIRGTGPTRIGVNGLWLVRGVTQGASYTPLKVIAARIDALLQDAPPAVYADGNVFSSVRHMPFSMQEISGGQQYRHRGGIYMIQTQG